MIAAFASGGIQDLILQLIDSMQDLYKSHKPFPHLMEEDEHHIILIPG